MAVYLKKTKGKCKPIKIDKEIQTKVKNFKHRLQQYLDNNEEERYNRIIFYILNKLDDYDLNILIAYYEFGESPSALGKILNVNPSIITHKINKLIKKIKKECLDN